MVKGKRNLTVADIDPDYWARAQDFFSRHGGRGPTELRKWESEEGKDGWWEVKAKDGYRLRCEWLRTKDEEQLTFREFPPT